jgi:uncharacterized protein (UPF0179 family)
VIITLIGEKQARVGFTFLNIGPLDKCKTCEYFGVCARNLETNRVYSVTEVIEGYLPCPVHEDGVRAVKVVETTISAAIPIRTAILDSVITFCPQECENMLCKSRELCLPLGLYDGDKCSVAELKDDIKCPFGRSLKTALLNHL